MQDLTAYNIASELSGVTHKSPSKVAMLLYNVGLKCVLYFDGSEKGQDLYDLDNNLEECAVYVQVITKGGGMVMLNRGQHTAFDVADTCRDLARECNDSIQ